MTTDFWVSILLCLYLQVDFEFRSLIYAKLSSIFFDQVVKVMVDAFLKRASVLHGPPSIAPQEAKILVYKK